MAKGLAPLTPTCVVKFPHIQRKLGRPGIIANRQKKWIPKREEVIFRCAGIGPQMRPRVGHVAGGVGHFTERAPVFADRRN